MHMKPSRSLIALACLMVAAVVSLDARQQRIASPEGVAATQVNKQWIELVYGRPILRGRTNIFGSGADYATTLKDGGPVWRAGANLTTVLRTEAPLEIGGKRLAPGDYGILIDTKSPTDWTLIVTTQARQKKYDRDNKTELYGGFNYRPDNDVARAPMRVEQIPYSVDQLTWGFTDVTATGGTMRIWWEKTMASVPFKVVS